jgi:hypothetical protein
MDGMGAAEGTVFLKVQTIRRPPFILGSGVIPAFALAAG